MCVNHSVESVCFRIVSDRVFSSSIFPDVDGRGFFDTISPRSSKIPSDGRFSYL